MAYDRLPVAALLSLSRGLDELRARLGEVRCPVLVLTSRHDHVVPTVSSDVMAGAVSGAVERVWLERSRHVATLDLDRHELERRVVDFAGRVTARASELGRAPEGQEQPGDDDARRGESGEGAGEQGQAAAAPARGGGRDAPLDGAPGPHEQ